MIRSSGADHPLKTAGLLLAGMLVLVHGCGQGQAEAPPAPPPAEGSPPTAAPPATLSFEGDASAIERVVIVSIDTLRADHVGCYGAEDAETPTMDGLARDGVRFETAISPTPITLPSHSTLLTGVDPPRHGVRHNGLFRLGPELPTLAERAREAGFATAAFISAYVLDRQFGLARGFDLYDDNIGASHTGHAGPSVPKRAADQTVDAALGWVEAAPDRFFLFVHLYDPHADHTPPEPYRTRFGRTRLYDAEIAFADAEVGRLLSGIAERWPAGTLVAVTSDHGESRGDHGEPTHSLTIYEATQHVPLLLAGPGVPSGVAVPEVVRLADVTPTVTDLLGIPPVDADGKTMRGLWSGEPGPPRVAWVETLATQLDFGWSPLLGVRTETHKYIRAPRPELYALASDAGELHDLAASEPELVGQLDALVGELATGIPITPVTDLGADERAQLEALGYVTEGAPRSQEELGVVGGTDPKDEMHLLQSLFEGMNLLARRRWDEALEKFNVMGNRSLELSIMRGQAALASRKLDIAREAAAAAAAFAPGRGQPHVLSGQIEEIAGRHAEARAAYQRAIEIEPSQGAAWVGLGRIAEAAGELEEARASYKRASEARIFESEAIWRQAALDIESGKAASARLLLASLPQGELRQPHAVVRLAQAESQAEKGEMARIRVAGALRAYPDDVPLLLMHAIFLELDGDAGGALRARRDALAAYPSSVQAQQAVSRQLSRQGSELDEALGLAEAGLKSVGREAPVLDTLARVYLAQARPAEAMALLDEAMAGVSGAMRTALLIHRAEALAGLGRGEEANATLEAARPDAAGNPQLEQDLHWTQERVTDLLAVPSVPSSP